MFTMEGYDNMDNNLSSGSGIPNVGDIKFDDTPAESFDNLYGGVSQSSNNNVGVNNGGINPNPSLSNVQMPNVSNQGPISNIGVQAQPSVNNVVQPSQVADSIGVQSSPQVMANPGFVNQQSVGAQVVQPNVGGAVNQPVNSVGVQPVNSGIQANSGFPNINQEPVMAPNPGTIIQPQVMTPNPGTIIQPEGIDMSSIDIDASRMQSIEEQLSKTSQYNPADFQQEQISISSDNQSEKSKSGLTFLIVLSIILGLVIAFLPQITKLIK